MDIIKAIQQKLQQFGQQNPDAAQSIINAGEAPWNAVQAGAKSLANVQVPGANLDIPAPIQSAFPVTQVPGAVQNTLQSQGRIASGQGTPADYVADALTLAGIMGPKIAGALKSTPEESLSPSGIRYNKNGNILPEQFPADITQTPEAQIPYAGSPKSPRAIEAWKMSQNLPPATKNGLPVIGGIINAVKQHPIAGALSTLAGGGLIGGTLGGLIPSPVNAIGGLLAGAKLATKQPVEAQTPEEVSTQNTANQKIIDSEVPSPFKANTVDTTTNNVAKIAQLKLLQGSEEYLKSKNFDPLEKYATQVDQALDALTTQVNNQNVMRDNYTATAALDAKFINVINAVRGNTDWLNRNDWYQKIMESGDPAFNELQGLIAALKNQPGFDESKVINATGESAMKYLEGFKTQMLTDYQNIYKSFGETPMTPPEIPTPEKTSPSSSGFIPGPLTGGGEGAGLSKHSLKGLSPLQPNGLPLKIPPKFLYR